MTAPAALAANPLDEFLERYGNNPVLFVEEVLGGQPDEKQAEVLNAIARGERRISVRSGHGVGKTTVMAWAIVWFACCRFPQKTVCTAPTTQQLFDALAAETKSWFKKLPDQLQALFDIKSESIVLIEAPEESFISFRTSRPETPEAMAGVHSANVLLIGDEASGIPEQVFEAAIGSMSGHSAITLLCGNPVRSAGLFYRTHNDPATMDIWHKIHISCVNHPRIAADFVMQVAAQYGENSNAFRVRVLGEFPLADDDTVIPFELVESALKRDVKPLHTMREVWGVDCGRFGNDPSALARRKGNVLVRPVEIKQGLDMMQLAGWVKSEYDALAIADRPVEINVDVIGIGAGVVDRLRELGLPVRGINVSEAPALSEFYRNQRAELWFRGLEWFTARDCNFAGDDLTMRELIGPRFKFTSNGKKQVESKDEMKKRGLPSPNRADAFLLTLASDAIVAMQGSAHSTSWNKPIQFLIPGIV